MAGKGKDVPKEEKTTKRQARLAKLNDPGADDNERGEVRGPKQNMEWKNKDGKWIPAIYHEDIRAKLLAMASNNGHLSYTHGRKHGFLPHDETAFLASQQHWGEDRAEWHHVPGDLLNRLDRLDHEGRDYEVYFMYDDGQIVLDMDNHPVVDYEDIPVVCSSALEGWLMETIHRVDPRIERTDFRARMPWERKSTPKGKVQSLFTLSSIGNRSMRWRQEKGIVSWTQRSGSNNLRDYIISLLSEEGRKNNTTRELVKDLTKEQREEARKPNKGVHMSRAGLKRKTEDSRNVKTKKSSTKLSKNSANACKAKKRKAHDDFDDDVDVENLHDSQRLKTKTSDGEADEENATTHSSSGNRPTNSEATNSKSQRDEQNCQRTKSGASRPRSILGDLSVSQQSSPFVYAGLDDSVHAVGNEISNSSQGHQELSCDEAEFWRYASGGAAEDEGSLRLTAAHEDDGYLQQTLYSADRPSLNQAGPPGGVSRSPNWPPSRTDASRLVNSIIYPDNELELEIMGEQDFEGLTLPTINIGDLIATGSDHLSLKRNRGEEEDEDEGEPSDLTLRKTKRARVEKPVQTPGGGQSQQSAAAPPPHLISPSHHTSGGKKYSDVDSETSSGNDTTTAATMSVQLAQPESAEDYRFKVPQSEADRMQIDAALVITRNHFESLFGLDGEPAPLTSFYDSYAKQYATMQQEISIRWQDSEIENLEHLSAWSGGFDEWTAAEVTDETFAEELWRNDEDGGTNFFDDAL